MQYSEKKSFLVPRPLKLGPGYPSSIAGDGPRREDRESKSTDESPTSDSKSGSSDYRPPTPPKPRGMSKRNYKNMVRKHRKKYPTRKPKDRANCRQDDQSVRLKIKEQTQTETPTSCNPSFSNNDSHPPTPPMSRYMTKRSYKNIVEKHRKKYLATSCSSIAEQKFQMIPEVKELQTSRDISSDTRRSSDLRIRRPKRRTQDPETKKKASKARALRRKVLGPLARKKDV